MAVNKSHLKHNAKVEKKKHSAKLVYKFFNNVMKFQEKLLSLHLNRKERSVHGSSSQEFYLPIKH